MTSPAKRPKVSHDRLVPSDSTSSNMAPANSVEASEHFQDRLQRNDLVVKDAPKFDLESYIQNYDGRTRIDRLLHIGKISTFLSVEALGLAVTQSQQSIDTDLYRQAAETLSKVAPNDPLGHYDADWVDRKNKGAKIESERLESELKSYRNNLIKESIRMGNEDLGRHYYQTGQLPESWQSYIRMRDYCTSPRHIADMTFHLVLVAIQQRNWQSALSQLQKVEANLRGDDYENLTPVVNALFGLCNMQLGNLKTAARAFISTKFAYSSIDKSKGRIVWQREVLTANDVAVYGGLCALASMTREELHAEVLENSEFRQFLELEPHIRRAISLFCSSKYSACLEVLQGYRADYLLDIFLQPVLHDLYGSIRAKSIVQYFIPFSCVTLEEMQNAFQTSSTGVDIETELANMIDNGVLNARIDLVEGLLLAPRPNPRHVVHEQAITTSKEYQNTLRLRLMRLNMLNAGLEVKSPRGPNMMGMSDVVG